MNKKKDGIYFALSWAIKESISWATMWFVHFARTCLFVEIVSPLRQTYIGSNTYFRPSMSLFKNACSPASLNAPILTNSIGRTGGSHLRIYLLASWYCFALMHSSTNGYGEFSVKYSLGREENARLSFVYLVANRRLFTLCKLFEILPISYLHQCSHFDPPETFVRDFKLAPSLWSFRVLP